MDRMIYTALSGAKQILDQQAAVSNNLANVSTPGFRAQASFVPLSSARAQDFGLQPARRAFVPLRSHRGGAPTLARTRRPTSSTTSAQSAGASAAAAARPARAR